LKQLVLELVLVVVVVVVEGQNQLEQVVIPRWIKINK
jgi:hypothetical protein